MSRWLSVCLGAVGMSGAIGSAWSLSKKPFELCDKVLLCITHYGHQELPGKVPGVAHLLVHLEYRLLLYYTDALCW